MKSDSQVMKDVIEELRWNPQTSRAEIGVAVRDGVVTLSGTVSSYAVKLAAERCARRVSGVRALAEDLEVKHDGTAPRSDTEIAHAAVNALRWDTQVPDDHITLKVDNGWITLEGEVQWKYQSDAAINAVRYLTGVRGMTNLIRIKPAISSASVKANIEQALKRSAELDAQQISVDALDGRVILRGRVRSWTERKDAENAAWAAPGVSAVDDFISVSA